MSETTPKPIDKLADVDTAALPPNVRLEVNYQGDNGGTTAAEAGVDYQYFYFSYQATPNPDENQNPDINMTSTLSMDPDQIVGNDWRLVKLTVSRISQHRRVTIEATVKSGTIVTLRDDDSPGLSSTKLTVKEGQTSVFYHLAQEGEDVVVTNPKVNPEDAQIITGIFNNLMHTAQKMVDSGFANGQPY